MKAAPEFDVLPTGLSQKVANIHQGRWSDFPWRGAG